MAFGERSHKGRQVVSAVRRAMQSGRSIRRATIGIKVHVGRYVDAGTGRGRFYATACPAGSEKKWRTVESSRYRCGPDGYGNTPTRAVEDALKKLAASHVLRK